MKDYSTNEKDREMFVLNYEINEDKITINYATGGKGVIPFTKENINKLQSKMKEQVRKSEGYKIKIEKEIKKSKIGLFVMVGALFLNFIAIIDGIFTGNLITFLGANPLVWMGGIGVLLTFPSVVDYAFSIDSYKKKLKDIEKNELFLKNEKLLNKRVNSKENPLLNSAIDKEKISNLEEPTININTIDKMKYEKLKQILLVIKRDELFDSDYTPDPNKPQKIYTKNKSIK